MNQVPILIPSTLRHYCGEHAEVTAAGDSIAEVLNSLSAAHPELYQSICDETGSVRRHINVFINSQWIPVHQNSGLDSKIGFGDTLTIWTAVSGG